MSSALEDVRAVLAGSVGVTNLVGTKLFPLKAKQGTAAPYVVITTISDAPSTSFTNAVSERLTNARVQVDCYAATYLAANALAAAVEAALDTATGPNLNALRDGRQDLYDDGAELYRVSVDFSVWR